MGTCLESETEKGGHSDPKKKKIQLHESNIYIWSDTFVLFAPYVHTLHVKEKL